LSGNQKEVMFIITPEPLFHSMTKCFYNVQDNAEKAVLYVMSMCHAKKRDSFKL